MISGAASFGLVTMKYVIEGADKKTGQDHKIIISAENTTDAQNRGAGMGNPVIVRGITTA